MKMNKVGGFIGAGLVVAIAMLTVTSKAGDSLVPPDMAYVGQGPSMMGLDKAQPSDSSRRLTLYDKRMKTPLSAEAFHDEGPAHMVFLDYYLIDRYEVSNKDYGHFIKTTRSSGSRLLGRPPIEQAAAAGRWSQLVRC